METTLRTAVVGEEVFELSVCYGAVGNIIARLTDSQVVQKQFKSHSGLQRPTAVTSVWMAGELGGEEIRGSKISIKINEAGCEPETWDLRVTDGGCLSPEDMRTRLYDLSASDVMMEIETSIML